MPEDLIDFRKNGHVLVTMNNVTTDLRRPTAGELLDLRNALLDISDERRELVALGETVTDEIDPSLSEEDQEKAAAERRAAVKQLRKTDTQRDLLQWEFDAYGGWIAQVFSTLGAADAESLVVRDVPAWLLEVELLTRFVQHWRAVPLARGN